jgi:hypothetical protein
MQDGEPTHYRIIGRIWQRIIKSIGTDMHDAMTQSAALRELDRSRMYRALQLDRRHEATNILRQVTRRAAETRADINDATTRHQPKPPDRSSN